MDADTGSVRYTYRLRVGSGAERLLLSEWDRCRWVWNQCVAESVAAHRRREKIGPATLDKMCTAWRAEHAWLRAGASIPQKQMVRTFGASRAKAIKDIAGKLPMRRRAGMPRFKRKGLAEPTLNYTRNGFRFKGETLNLAGDIAVNVVWSRELPSVPTTTCRTPDSAGGPRQSLRLTTRRSRVADGREARATAGAIARPATAAQNC